MNIKEYITWLTSYRDNLIKFLQLRLEDLIGNNPKDEYMNPLLTTQKVIRILDEIKLCNSYLKYLHTWDNYFNGPVIPTDNKEIIKSVEQFINN